MIDELKPYPAYKDSGVPWLGNVPEHWGVRRNGSLFAERRETSFPDLPILEVSLRTGVQVRNFESSNRKQTMSDRSAYKRARAGDLAYNIMRMWQGAVGVAPVDGLVSPAYVVARPFEDIYSRYFEYLFRTTNYMAEVNNYSRGIVADRNRLYWDEFKAIPSPVPPTAEQFAIACFLDSMDRRVARYIRAKKKVMALLEEQKQVIVHRGVTRGLDANVRRKPSGVEWLGDVPEHWTVSVLGRCLTNIEQGWSPVASEGVLGERQWAVLTLSSVRRGTFNAAAIKPVSAEASVPQRIEVQNGDFLLTRSNTRDRVGDVCIVAAVRPKTILCDLIYRLQVDSNRIDRQFLMLQLLSPLGRMQIEKDARGSSGTMPKISQRHIRSWRVTVPPIREQREIVVSTLTNLDTLSATSERLQREISLFREYRTRLIADVVTGKVDVRDATARLPDQTDEIPSFESIEETAQEDEGGLADEEETLHPIEA